MTSFLVKHFIKNYDDVKNSNVRQSYVSLGGFVGIFCNIFLFIIKLTIGLFSGSVAVMADAFNNLSDIGSSVVTMLGFKMAGKPADPEHPFGHGRIEYMSGFIVSMLIMLMGVELLKSSIKKIIHPEELTIVPAILIGLAISVGIKLWMFFFNRHLGKRIKSSALKATSMDSLSDSISTTAVLMSVVISAVFSINIDAYMGIAVACFVIYSGINIAKETLNPLLGTPPDPQLVKELERRVMSCGGFVGIHDLIIHNYGPGRIFASLHVEVPADIDIVRCHETIDLCEREVGEALNLQLLIHMDPIVTDNEQINTIKSEMLDRLKEIDAKLTLHDFRMVEGECRSNLIFDVVIPPNFNMSNDELRERIDTAAKLIDSTFSCVINFDLDYA